MKKTILLLTSLLLTIGLSAAERTIESAQQEAISFLHSQSHTGQHRVVGQDHMTLCYTIQQPSTEKAAAYVFQNAEAGGFVLVSADDATRTILGYSHEGTFRAEDMPANMRFWLQRYANEIAHYQSVPTHPTRMRTAAAPAKLQGVEPLLGDIVWGQTAPFYYDCPLDSDNKRCVTGCVATAAAQIMRYWKYPACGTGEHRYEWTRSDGTTDTLSSTFSEPYDWSNMLANYNDHYSAKEAAAVSHLLSDVGIACSMGYSSNESGTNDMAMAEAFISHFKYDAAIRMVNQDVVGNKEFEKQMKAEIDASRPVFISGTTTRKEGHAFVCDGYDSDQLFHINWGWNGFMNGYFALSALDPEQQGVGGAASGEGYRIDVTGLMGLQPDKGGELYHPGQLRTKSFELLSPKQSSRNDEIVVQIQGLYNNSLEAFSGYLYICIYDKSNQYIATLDAYNFGEMSLNQYYPDGLTFYGYLPQSLSDGEYYLKPLSSPDSVYDYPEQYEDIVINYDANQTLPFEVKNDEVSFDVITIDYTIQDLNVYAQNDTIFFSYTSVTEAPYYHIQMYNDKYVYINELIDFQSGYLADALYGEWTFSVRPVDKAQAYYLSDEATTTVTHLNTHAERVYVDLAMNDNTMGYVIGANTYEVGKTAQIIAAAKKNCKFVKWSDGNTEEKRTIEVTLPDDDISGIYRLSGSCPIQGQDDIRDMTIRIVREKNSIAIVGDFVNKSDTIWGSYHGSTRQIEINPQTLSSTVTKNGRKYPVELQTLTYDNEIGYGISTIAALEFYCSPNGWMVTDAGSTACGFLITCSLGHIFAASQIILRRDAYLTQYTAIFERLNEAIENIEDTPALHKVLQDGQILIRRGTSTYNLQGVKIE